MKTSSKNIFFILISVLSMNMVYAQCGITHSTDTTFGGGALDFEVDFSGLSDPAKGWAHVELFNWEGNSAEQMVFNSSFTLMQFMLVNNENLDYRLILQDTTASCVDTVYGSVTMTSNPSNFHCDPRHSYTSDLLNMDYVFTSDAPYNPLSCTYNWQFEWNISGTGNPASHTFSDSVIQDWVVSLNVQGPDCYFPNAYIEDTITAGYIPECNANFDLIGDSLDQSTYYAYNYSYGGFISHFWDFGDGNTSNDPFPTHTYTSIGDFEICLTVSDTSGCQETFCDTIFVVVKSGTTLNVIDGFNLGLADKEIGKLNIYPNPTDGIITLEINAEFVQQTELKIFDSSGRLVFRQNLIAYPGLNKYELFLGDLDKGLYLFTLDGNSGKLLVE